MFVAVCRVFPQVVLLFLFLIAAGAATPFQRMLQRLVGIIHYLCVEDCGIRVRAAF